MTNTTWRSHSFFDKIYGNCFSYEKSALKQINKTCVFDLIVKIGALRIVFQLFENVQIGANEKPYTNEYSFQLEKRKHCFC